MILRLDSILKRHRQLFEGLISSPPTNDPDSPALAPLPPAPDPPHPAPAATTQKLESASTLSVPTFPLLEGEGGVSYPTLPDSPYQQESTQNLWQELSGQLEAERRQFSQPMDQEV